MNAESFEMGGSESMINPQVFDSFDGTHLRGLPEVGGKFELPPGTKLYTLNGKVEILDAAKEVIVGAIEYILSLYIEHVLLEQNKLLVKRLICSLQCNMLKIDELLR
jgi:hypothetical protein